MYSSDLYRRISGEVDKITIIDTHEHLTLPSDLAKAEKLDFGRLFIHYAKCDLISAGMPVEDMGKVIEPNSGWSVEQKWQALKPYYERSWNTGYCECLRIAIRDIYGIEDFSDDTVEGLSAKIDAVERRSWTRTVFDRAGIEVAMLNGNAAPVYHRERYPDLFLYDMTDDFSALARIPEMREETGLPIDSLDSFLHAIDWYFDKFADEACALKIGRAYDRTLFFDDVEAPDAFRVFERFLKEPLRKNEIQPLEDFIVHYCLEKCAEHDLPVKFHTGLQEGNGNDIKNSRAGLMTNLFLKYPKTRFDIFHISWPYTEELTAICKNFPNVYIDFCWAWIFNPPAARRYLGDMLETVPINKIHGFGGDYVFVEGTYGHSVIARREIAQVLAEKVEAGRFSEEFAVRAAQRMLRDNVLENFRIEDKRKVYAERAQTS
ncbi:MAG TPA: amidohydrolase family protein [Armatimonadota bacterium]|nr:amidohydrolase family protein [Armatimonadota bacterium]